MKLGHILAGCALLGLVSKLRDLDFVGNIVTSRAKITQITRCAGDKRLKDRWTSVGKTAKTTDAMRLVASAKVRSAQRGVEKARPFSDELLSMIKGLVKKLKGTGLEADLPMLRVPEKVNNVGILMITSQRGLCGGYNAFVFKKTKARIADLNKEGIVPKLFVIGRKGVAGLKIRFPTEQLNFTGESWPMPDTIAASVSTEIAETLENYFLSGEVDKIEIVYSRFINLISNEPAVRTLLPLSPVGIEDPEDETFKLTTEDGKLKVEREKAKTPKAKEIEADVIFDQPPEILLNSMLPGSFLISLSLNDPKRGLLKGIRDDFFHFFLFSLSQSEVAFVPELSDLVFALWFPSFGALESNVRNEGSYRQRQGHPSQVVACLCFNGKFYYFWPYNDIGLSGKILNIFQLLQGC